MSEPLNVADGIEIEIEPERYELREAPTYRFELDRRDFLKALGGGILVCYLLDAAEAQQPGGRRRGGGGGGGQACTAGHRRLAAHRRGRPDHRLHRQGRGRPEHPHLADSGRGRRAARCAELDSHGHGRHATDPVRHGHIRQPDHSRHVATTAAHGRRRPRSADRRRGRNLEGRPIAPVGGRWCRRSLQDQREARIRQADQGQEAHESRL